MSGREEPGGERSFEPTPRRLEEARRRGEVPRSADLGAAAASAGLLAALLAAGRDMAEGTGAGLAVLLARAGTLGAAVLGGEQGGPAAALLAAALLPLLPLVLLPALAALAAHLAQRAFTLAPRRLLPDPGRLSPLRGAVQRFGPAGLVEFAKSCAKLLAVAAALWFVLAARIDEITATLLLPPVRLPGEMMRHALALVAAIAGIAAVVAAADLLWQRFHHARRLRMSFRELRDELRETEGDPRQKQARRARAEATARNRMFAELPKADVVIVNPEHVAVALRWSRRPRSAPECVAKGRGELALAIRRRAMETGVPLRHDPPTARALHALVGIGEEVPPELWRAVAAALRYAEAMRRRAREGWR